MHVKILAMKKCSLLLITLIINNFFATAQEINPNCPGLKNPTSFVITPGYVNASYTTYIGHKIHESSSCSEMCWDTIIALASDSVQFAPTIGTLSSCMESDDRDLWGAVDYTHRFSIKGAGYDSATDYQLSFLPPDTSFHSSIRLGSYCSGAEAEMLTYEFDVNAFNTLITIWYAISLQNAQHQLHENPEFVIIVEKQVGNNWVLASSGNEYCYIQDTPTPGLPNDPFQVGNRQNLFYPWTKVIINVSDFMYQHIRIRVASCDCQLGSHYGCSYIAGDCQPMRMSVNGCTSGGSNQVAEVVAPADAKAYYWYRSKTGVLSGPELTEESNFEFIPEEGIYSDTLHVMYDHFINNTDPDHLDTMNINTFMCKIVTRLNPQYPIISKMFVDVGNRKPQIRVDSILTCDAAITLRDISYVPYVLVETDRIDTSLTQWLLYDSISPSSTTLIDSVTGGSITHQFSEAGHYCVLLRSFSIDSSCWNERIVPFRTIKTPQSIARLSRDSICKGDAIELYDDTPEASYREWVIHLPQGDTVIRCNDPVFTMSFDTTTAITLRSYIETNVMTDTNVDGFLEPLFCANQTDTVVHVLRAPRLTITGKTELCDGESANITIQSDYEGCRFDWYNTHGEQSPLQLNSDHLNTTLQNSRRIYLKTTTPEGCILWDSLDFIVVKPTISSNTESICDGESVTLWAENAVTFDWTSSPSDPTLAGQEQNDTVTVSPTQTTTYSVVGHGGEGCDASPKMQKIIVYPYPLMQFELSPEYIDSENPSVQFTDISLYGVTSLWEFGNGQNSNSRNVVHTFTDLSQDSVLISLTSGNQLGCSNDTSFFIPVRIFAVWFPNAITPDLETNRIFKAYTANQLDDYHLYIYERGGNLVFQTANIEEGWDGTYKGKKLKQDAYVYIATYRRHNEQNDMKQKGTFIIIR